MAYSLTYSLGTLTVADTTINSQTSLNLPGRNYAGYGQAVDQNQLSILENFASYPVTGPVNPIPGQTWYDTASGSFNINTSTNSTPNWSSIVTSGGPLTTTNITTGSPTTPGTITGAWSLTPGSTFNISAGGIEGSVQFNSSDTITGSSALIFNSATSELTNTGDITAQNINSLSDATMKTNITPLLDPVTIISKLMGVEYDWKNGTGHSYGLLAQDVEPILPAAVKTNVNGIKSINYQMIIPFLIETVKHLSDEIQEMKKAIK